MTTGVSTFGWLPRIRSRTRPSSGRPQSRPPRARPRSDRGRCRPCPPPHGPAANQRLTETHDVRRRGLHQQIDVFCRANESGLDDRHAADDHVTGACLVEVAAQRDEIAQAGRSGFGRAIIWRDHAALSRTCGTDERLSEGTVRRCLSSITDRAEAPPRPGRRGWAVSAQRS